MTPRPRRARPALRTEQGIALVLAILVLFSLTGLVISFLAVSALEPRISRNLADGARARYLAEAGIEQGFNVLVQTADGDQSWTGLLAGATAGRPWVPLPGLTGAVIPGAPEAGTFSVTVRNDHHPTDTIVTGLTDATTPPLDVSPTADANRVVVMRSRGTFRDAAKTIEVVVRRLALPALPGAVNVPGGRLEGVVGATGLDIDGRDHACALPGNQCDVPSGWAMDVVNPMKYGIAVPPGAALEPGLEAALESGAGRDALRGRSRSTGEYATGPETVAADPALTPTLLDDFVARLAAHPAAAVLGSTRACPMVVTGSAAGLTSTPRLANGCGLDTTVSLGTRSDPRLVFFRGGVDTAEGVKGAGILVVQDGDITNRGTLEWDGLVIVAGRGASIALAEGSRTAIRGAAGAVDVRGRGAAAELSIRASRQNLDMAQRTRALHAVTNWREL